MSALLEITEKIQDTQAAITRLANAAANNPDSTSIHLSLDSLQKRQRDLEAQLAKIITSQHVDMPSHRVSPDDDIISNIRRFFDLDEPESRPRLREVEAAYRRRKDLLLTSSALVATGIALCLCAWVIVSEGSTGTSKELAWPFLTAIVTGFIGYVTGRATK
jgi:hypothetical protein